MKHTGWPAALVALAALVAPAGPASAAGCSVAGLGWMAGTWRSSADPARAQESWVVAPGGVLMGNSWEFPAQGGGYAEILTVRPEGAAIIMVLRHFDVGLKKAWEEREAPMIFLAADCDAQSVVFDGQGDRSGEHLTYRRSGTDLLILGDFLHGGKPLHVEFHMSLAPG
jgi:hypothetical protein